MDIRKIIIKHLNRKKELKIAEIVKETGLSRAYIHRFFKELQNEGKIVLIGRTNQARYALAKQSNLSKKPLSFRRTLLNKDLFEDLVLGDIKRETAIFHKLKNNVADTLDYAFTEMLNNAIEHSKSKKILIQIEKTNKTVKFTVTDWGIGIYHDIKRKFKLRSTLEAIETLLKGKQTTVPESHTGEGVFFTSKVADKLSIRSSSKNLIFDNRINDIFVRDIKPVKGTRVVFEISALSKKKLSIVFREYTSKGLIFDKTKVNVKLFELAKGSYVSRSQARRLLFGLDKFKKIILDFQKVQTVGQAFTDEIFRVWQKRHPNIKIEYINSNKNIEFMISRVLK